MSTKLLCSGLAYYQHANLTGIYDLQNVPSKSGNEHFLGDFLYLHLHLYEIEVTSSLARTPEASI